MSLSNGLLGLGALAPPNKDSVWALGTEIPGYDPAVWRYDAHGNVLKYSDYGDRNSTHGWEIDHYPIPKVLGGGDHLGNVRPLHYVANASHGGLLGAFLNRKFG